MVTLTVVKVFFAGCRDVSEERSLFRQVAEEQDRHVAMNLSLKVQPCGWEDTMPACGRPQEVIDKDIDECNLFVLSLFMRWGTPTGEYSAGIEEEFERALKRRSETGEPEIWLFFRDIAEDRLVDPGDELKKVIAFRTRVERERLLLYHPYRDPPHWAAMFGDFLSRWLFQTAGQGGPGPGDRLSPSEARAGVAEGSEYVTSTPDLQAEVESLRAQVVTAETKLRRAVIDALMQAKALEEEGRMTEAEAAFVRALDLFEVPEGRNDFGVYLARADRLREAASQFERACELEPDPLRLHNWGTALMHLAKASWEGGERKEARRLYDGAFQRFRQAVKLKPDMHAALNNWGNGLTDLADGLWQVGEHQEGRRLYAEGFHRYSEAVAVKPDMYEALYNWGRSLGDLAGALWEAGERGEARRLYEEAFERYGEVVAVKPDYHGALYNWGNGLTDLAKGLSEAGDGEEARRLYEEGFQRYSEALAVKPDKHQALHNWGVTLREYAKLAPARRRGAIVRDANRKIRQAAALAPPSSDLTTPPAPSPPAPA